MCNELFLEEALREKDRLNSALTAANEKIRKLTLELDAAEFGATMERVPKCETCARRKGAHCSWVQYYVGQDDFCSQHEPVF